MRDSLIAQIERDFAGVSREGGVSISEAYAIDDYEPEEVRAAARLADTYSRWNGIDIAKEDPAGSALSFFDSIGFRFHLPAYMCFKLRHGHQCLGSHIDSNALMSEFHLRIENDHVRQKLSLLSASQRRCVARFLVFEAYASELENLGGDYLRVLRADWLRHLPSGEQKRLQARWPQLRR